MIKRIFVLCLVALLCVPCLGVLAMAETEYTYVASADTDSMFVGTMADKLPEGYYSCTGVAEINGTSVEISVSGLTVTYADDGDGMMMCMCPLTIDVDGSSLSVYFVLGYVDVVDQFMFALGSNELGPLPGTFTFASQSASDAPSYRLDYVLGETYSGNVLPPEGQYAMDLTYDGITDSYIVDIVYEESSYVSGLVSFHQAFYRGYQLAWILSLFAERLFRPALYKYFDSWEIDKILPELPSSYKPYAVDPMTAPVLRKRLRSARWLFKNVKKLRKKKRREPAVAAVVDFCNLPDPEPEVTYAAG